MQLKKHIRKISRASRVQAAKDALKFNPKDTAAQKLLDQLALRPCKKQKVM